MALTTTQLTDFRERGYFNLGPVFSTAELSEIRERRGRLDDRLLVAKDGAALGEPYRDRELDIVALVRGARPR